MTLFETRRMGRTNLIIEYMGPRSFAHGSALDNMLIQTVGWMSTDRLAALVLTDRENRHGKRPRPVSRSSV